MHTKIYLKFKPFVKMITGVVVIAVILLGYPFSAQAKGPAAVTITGPGIEQPIDLMEAGSFDLITQLMEQSGIWYGVGDLPTPVDKPGGDLGHAYTLTWVNGGPPGTPVEDRTIVQYLYLDAETGMLIHTPPQESLQDWGQGVIGWFAAPAGLPDTLAELGVPLSAGPTPDQSVRADQNSLSVQLAAYASRYSVVIGASVFALLAILFGVLYALNSRGDITFPGEDSPKA